MEKKLPKVFANKVEGNAGNNENVYYSYGKNKIFVKKERNKDILFETGEPEGNKRNSEAALEFTVKFSYFYERTA